MLDCHVHMIHKIVFRNQLRPDVAERMVEEYRQSHFLAKSPETTVVRYEGTPILRRDLDRAVNDLDVFSDPDLTVWDLLPARYLQPDFQEYEEDDYV